MLDVSPGSMWEHGTSIELTMFIVRDIACHMRHLRVADKVNDYMAGRGCFPKAWEPTGGGGGLCAVDQRWVDMLRAQLQSAVSTSAASLTTPAEWQEQRRRRQFAHNWQPPTWMFRGTLVPNLAASEFFDRWAGHACTP